MQYRKNDNSQFRFRISRFYLVGDEYFFSTREEQEIGPFPNKGAAERSAELYCQVISRHGVSRINAAQIAMQGLWASTNYS